MTTDLGSGVRVEVLKYQVPARWLAEPERSGLGHEWLGDAAAHLAGGGSVTFGLRGDDPEPTSTHLIVRAKAAPAAVTTVMKQRHAHQDGAHSSFLTPRAVNDRHGITATSSRCCTTPAPATSGTRRPTSPSSSCSSATTSPRCTPPSPPATGRSARCASWSTRRWVLSTKHGSTSSGRRVSRGRGCAVKREHDGSVALSVQPAEKVRSIAAQVAVAVAGGAAELVVHRRARHEDLGLEDVLAATLAEARVSEVVAELADRLPTRRKAEETGAARLGSEESEVSTLLASLSLPAEYPLTRTTTANLISATTH